MKTMIIYVTKYGATARVAKELAEKIGNAKVVDLGKEQKPDLTTYDCVILGSPVTAGTIKKELKNFTAQNLDLFLNKQVGLFLCGLQKEQAAEFFQQNFPAELLAQAKTAFVGGVYDPEKCGFFSKAIMKKVAHLTEYTDQIDHEKIDKFAGAFKE